MSWITSKIIRKKYGNKMLPYIIAGSAITIVANMIVIVYKMYIWKIIPISSMKVEITAALTATTIMEVITAWIMSKIKRFPLLEH